MWLPDVIPEYKADRWTLRLPSGEITVYSQRSVAREISQIRRLAEEHAGLLLVVAPWIREIGEALRRIPGVRMISPTPAGAAIDSPEKLDSVLRDLTGNERIRIHIHPGLTSMQDAIQESMRVHLNRAAARLKTVRHFGRLWEINFRANLPFWLKTPPVSETMVPDVIAGASPTLNFAKLRNKRIWCADTALPALLHNGIIPDLVFSIDAKPASMLHFLDPVVIRWIPELQVVLDPASWPRLYRLPFAKICSYRSSLPQVQETVSHHPEIRNPEGDVGGLMRSMAPENTSTTGMDGRHYRYQSHIWPSAYSGHRFRQLNRTQSSEDYAFRLSLRYP